MPRKISNPLALAVLGLLLERPMHPYEMAATLRERHKGGTFKINPGSLYDTVESLARHGWIQPVATERDGRRPERTVYGHTDLGHKEFLAWLDELIRTPVAEYPKFISAISYLGALGRDGAQAALAERAHRLDERIEQVRLVLADTVGAGTVPRLFMIEVEYALHTWESELAWVRRTVEEIADGSLAWPEGEQ
ncbi:PadR family transcriptional regulator [Actinokineospora enzanensis]|uniref:PadR family transcriptional regulator n=1 Tax=Actinokineospora enzanensis TaxID=155975 RepID=UPI0003623B22|nr:PadR family transcriptional regulator [Actinokineospora enzanensis]